MTDVIFIGSVWDKELELGSEVLDYLEARKARNVAVFASAQFLKLDGVISQLKNRGIETRQTKAKRTQSSMQLLGCDVYHDSYEDDVFEETDATIYIGDGLFHPKALLLAQIYKKSIKEIVVWDPLARRMKVLTMNTVMDQVRRIRANIKSYVASGTVGILVTMKAGQQYLSEAIRLKEKLESGGKKAHIFIDNNLDLSQLENFPFIDSWVNTACPRIGSDDIVTIKRPLINIREAFDPGKALENLYWD